ncbi:MAG TPA: response regulator transcription factor [Acidimicrobiales bacterium]
MTSNSLVLVIEDDAAVLSLIGTVLRRQGFEVLAADTGRAGLRHIHEQRPAVVVLDLGLPDLDGWQVLERIRDVSEVPVLLLTGYAAEPDKVRGLRAGADDYLTKPFGLDELIARLEALLRRGRPGPDGGSDVFVDEVFVDEALRVDFARRVVTMGEEQVAMTVIEFKLLAALVRHPGQILSTDQLLRLAWDDTSGVGPDRVKFSVHRLRRKLHWDDLERSPIEAVRGFGYRFRPGPAPR